MACLGKKKRVQLVDDVLDLPLRWWLVEKKNQKTRDRWDVVVVVVVVVRLSLIHI